MAERKPVGNMGLTGDELFEAIREGMARRGVSDRRPAVTPFEVGGWHIHLRTLTAEWHAALNKRAEDHPGDEAGFAALLLSASVCDAESNTMLTCEQAAQLPYPWVVAIAEEVLRINQHYPEGDGQ